MHKGLTCKKLEMELNWILKTDLVAGRSSNMGLSVERINVFYFVVNFAPHASIQNIILSFGNKITSL